ncbi:hypothetical protein [Marixanthomonas spongiae]|uniref:Uncharacterized protein n=1 Tax=Marixanthomonas spongiae TaxID=2174845 RepID=A0A2U0I0J0_9FLAO|nr:hypothetical protein [Marixanthomonas spongiae]PVW14625.1 hypothetical protein DDV96_08850 [Marixanthomonas spongiae]
METKDLDATLNAWVGHLIITDKEAKRKFDELGELMSQSSFTVDACRPAKKAFSFEKSDLFFDDKISKETSKRISGISKRLTKNKDMPQYRVAKRETPLQHPMLPNSNPDWAVGAKAEKTIGPFIQKDGRNIWFDFFPIQKFVKLYIQGVNNPVLLFKTPLIQLGTQPLSDIISRSRNNTFSLSKGSIWIASSFLDAGAPTGAYTGLTLSGGTIALSEAPTIINGKLTVSANAIITVQLNLEQPEVEGADENSGFGEDARNMELQLPEHFNFHFSAQGRSIDSVSESSLQVYGQAMDFNWQEGSQTQYNSQSSSIEIPWQVSQQSFEVSEALSTFNTLSGNAQINGSAWALPVAFIDISQITKAQGIGAILLRTSQGVSAHWSGLSGSAIGLQAPNWLFAPGSILVADTQAKNAHALQEFNLWKDENNPFGTKVILTFPKPNPFFYFNHASGYELISSLTHAEFKIDRPVKVNGKPPKVKSLNSLLMLAVSDANKLVYLFDDNLIQDDYESSGEKDYKPKKFALALKNALFTVSQPNGCLLFGSLSNDYLKVTEGTLFLTFGLYRYIPTLPDPYAANLGILRRNEKDRPRSTVGTTAVGPQITTWLVCRVQWEPIDAEETTDAVSVSFHFAPLNNQFGGISLEESKQKNSNEPETSEPDIASTSFLSVEKPIKGATTAFATSGNRASEERQATENPSFLRQAVEHEATTRSSDRRPKKPLPNLDAIWQRATDNFRRDWFSLLDVSSNADLFGISFNLFYRGRENQALTHRTSNTGQDAYPIQVQDMEVVSRGINVKTFTVPQISWEPVQNLTNPQIEGDPPLGPNYYPNDGGPMHIINTGEDSVALAPIPLTNYINQKFESDPDTFKALSIFTLPFGLRAMALLEQEHEVPLEGGGTDVREGSRFSFNSEDFENDVKGGRQLQLDAGEAFINGESNMFVGSTLQVNNILDFTGNPTGDSTLGRTVTDIFNNEFLLQPYNLIRQRGVPLTRIDLSGYGASTFSNWLNPGAAFAATSQAKFDVWVGRCAHEIIQVKSIIYPWAIKVVRTITIFRVSSGYVYRHDSGWRAESDGNFDFRYFVNITPDEKTEIDSPFEIHPGIIKKLYNVQNIIETEEIKAEEGQMVSEKIVDENGLYVDNPNIGDLLDFKLQPVYFDADIEVENVTAGFVEKTIHGDPKKIVPSKKIVGYVQVGPRGIPISKEILRNLVTVQLGAIGGPISCEVNLANSDQRMVLNQFGFNNSFGDDGSSIVFALAGRGSVMLPKDGAWSMVKHERANGDVSPVPEDLSIPVIREGKVVRKNDLEVEIDTKPEEALLRIAEPSELLRQPIDATINYGFLQSTDTQKALVINPSFEFGSKQLMSKVPPLFVDAFRIVNSKGIFPNIGDADTNFGDVIPLSAGGTNPFPTGNLTDLGEQVFQLMDISDTIDNAKQQGYQLIKENITNFDLPDTEFELVNLGDGNFRIYIEYKGKDDNETKGELDFNIDSLAQDVAESWKSKMENVALVVDLAGIDRLMRISGSWDSKKGEEASYPKPKIEFSPVLEPVIEILQILQQLQGGKYASAVANGLKLAMSNKAGSWEYKLEASKEIPAVRFPVPDEVYNNPNTPLKLEAGLRLGAYFNAALKVTNDANELIPSAGGFLGFYGRLSVMCVSVSAATIYALGQVNLDIAADTKLGPSLRMKFGFGAQIVVGLPVAGNVSVLFMVGVEVFAAEGLLEVTGILLFEGHAEILGGIVSITIRIEAKGTVSRKALPSGEERTDMACQVTFGLDISIAFIINISFSESWQEQRQIA